MNRCRTCRHWTDLHSPEYLTAFRHGRCDRIVTYFQNLTRIDPTLNSRELVLGTYTTPAEIVATERGALHTLPDFGCMLWEEAHDRGTDQEEVQDQVPVRAGDAPGEGAG